MSRSEAQKTDTGGPRVPMSAMKRRDAFVSEVGATITSRHGKEGESFVFGLSGRWGEGKTHFLGQLRAELEGSGFEVIDLNPWKFAAERVAFLRAFLVKLLETQSVGSRWRAAWSCLSKRRWSDAWDMFVFRRFMLAKLRTDVTRQTISWFRLVMLVVLGSGAYWIYADALTQQQRDSLGFWKVPATFVLFTVVVWVARGLVGSQSSSKAATAVDEFDRLTNLALGSCDCDDGSPGNTAHLRQVVVFVDDLDRVTSSVARDVLDNLRTFFDKPALSFIVTGDHVVLEANLGSELLPHDGKPEQHQEGRLFLKKIFNVYWRLPVPVPSDFEAFVDAQLLERASEVERVIPDAEDRQRLREWLVHYCDVNLRQVIRTLDTLLFSLRLVHAQLAAATDEERPVLTKMARRPLLLGRVLMIQDNCAPFFELLVSDASLLLDLDWEVVKAQSADSDAATQEVVATFLSPLTGGDSPRVRLTERQIAFLTRFAYEKPQFYDQASGGQFVTDLAPWIHLAHDTSFGDTSGPRPEDFVRSLENGNREDLAASLARCSVTRATEVSAAAIVALSKTTDAEVRAQQLRLLLALLLESEPHAPLARQVAKSLVESIDPIVAGMPDPQRVPVLVAALAVLDYQGITGMPGGAEPTFAFRGAGDMQHLPREPYGRIGSRVVFEWLTIYYSQNQADCLRYLEELLPWLCLESLPSEISTLGQRLVDDLLSDGDASRRTQRLHLVMGHFQDFAPAVRDHVLDAFERPDVWTWAASVIDDDQAEVPWSRKQMEDTLIVWVAEAADESQLMQRLAYAVSKLESRSDDLWQRIDDLCKVDVAGLLDRFVQNDSLASLPLPESVATTLYEDRVKAAKDAAEGGDETRAVQIAQQMLSPAHWFWSSVDRKRARNSLRYLALPKARNQQLQAVVRPFFEQWN